MDTYELAKLLLAQPKQPVDVSVDISVSNDIGSYGDRCFGEVVEVKTTVIVPHFCARKDDEG